MKNRRVKPIFKMILSNILLLLVILFLVIAITGIPLDYGVTIFNGEKATSIGFEQIFESIKNNFKIILTGKAFSIKIQGKSVGWLLANTALKSSAIVLFGTLLAVLIGIPKGIIDSRKRDQNGTLKLLQSLVPLSVPDIFTIALIQLLAVYLFKNKITVLGIGPLPAYGSDTLLHAIYPIISISVLPAAYISRITANVIEDNFTKPYVLAARGKGCSNLQIIKNHMMKSIMFGLLSGFPTVMGIIFSSLIIVERLFHFQGMGFYLISFYVNTVFPSYEAGVAFTAFIVTLAIAYYLIFIILNILKDILLPKAKVY